MMVREKRPRGGQPGNLNALRHGYYSKGLKNDRKTDYSSAADVEGLDEEIAVLRLVIKEAVVAGDDKHLMLLVRAANSLNRLLRTRDKLLSTRDDQLKIAVSTVLRDVGLPLGIGCPPFPKSENESEDTEMGLSNPNLP